MGSIPASDSEHDRTSPVTNPAALVSPPPVKEVPDSDADNTQPPPDNQTAAPAKVAPAAPSSAANDDADGKMQQMIERMNDDSDDERAFEDPHDMGDDGEDDDVDRPIAHLNTTPPPGPAQADEVEAEPEVPDAPEEEVGEEEEDMQPTPPPPPAKKKARAPAKKGKELLPSRGIKKSGDSAAKAKPKAKPGARKAGASKKVTLNVAALQPEESEDENPAPKTPAKATKVVRKKVKASAPAVKGTTPQSSPRPAKALKAAKVTPKLKAGLKPAQKTPKEKVKKTIVKKASPAVKKPGLVRKTPTKTPTKKAAGTPTGKSIGKASAKTAKTPVKASAKGKAKVKKVKKVEVEDEEEEDDSADVEMESEGEEEGVGDVSADEESEIEERTPTKAAIVGNLACSTRDNDTESLLLHAVGQLGRYQVVRFDPDFESPLTAYVVGGESKRGWGMLQAVASGVPLVSEDWLSKSISEGEWQDMAAFRSDRFGQSPRSVTAAAIGHAKMLEGLRVKVRCEGNDRASVRKLVRLCGGRVAEARMDVVINDTESAVEGCVNVSKTWLADSIEAGAAIEYEPYVVGSG